MALKTKFLRVLDDALERRTDQLRRLVVSPDQGAPKKYTRAVRDRLKKRVLLAASAVLVNEHAENELAKTVLRRRLRFFKGHGLTDRFDRLYRWAERKLDGPIVYAFWRRKKCLYVGKGKSYRRLKHYDKSVYLWHANALEVWQIKTQSRLPRAECLAIHLFKPRDNKQKKAAKVKWGKACPICKRHDKIASATSSLLRL
ncbi:MAG: hypothetical protein ABR973_10545 [Candidatus Acidiferrales bacterium]